jgi:hypothetical protein
VKKKVRHDQTRPDPRKKNSTLPSSNSSPQTLCPNPPPCFEASSTVAFTSASSVPFKKFFFGFLSAIRFYFVTAKLQFEERCFEQPPREFLDTLYRETTFGLRPPPLSHYYCLTSILPSSSLGVHDGTAVPPQPRIRRATLRRSRNPRTGKDRILLLRILVFQFQTELRTSMVCTCGQENRTEVI